MFQGKRKLSTILNYWTGRKRANISFKLIIMLKSVHLTDFASVYHTSAPMAAPPPPPPRPRVMVLPFPAQGHIMPLMELSHRLVDHGFEVDFINTDYNHARILTAMAAGRDDTGAGGGVAAETGGIHLFSFPDGMDADGDRADIIRLAQGLPAAMLGGLEELVRAHNTRWVVADVSMNWALDLAATAGVRVAFFVTFAAATFVVRMRIPKMVEDGVIDECAVVKRNERIELSPNTAAIDAADIPWVRLAKSPETKRLMIKAMAKTNPTFALADTIVCNTFHAIESEALALLPKPPLAVGPLEAPAAAAAASSASQLWPEDPACLAWLDAQAPGSVVYVAFGSFTVFDAARLQELADGLALAGRPFLWVVRPNFADGADERWLDEFRRRVGDDRGLVVGWAPQQRVLSHPSVACFVSHCGWNSTMEGVRRGVPFLCWPYFADQFLNQNYICDVWGTGVRIVADDRGIVTKEEIRDKVDRLLGDDGIRARALALKRAACESTADGGASHQDLLKFVNLLREQ